MARRRVDDRVRAVCERCGFVAYRNPVCAEQFDNLEFLQLVNATRGYRLYKSR